MQSDRLKREVLKVQHHNFNELALEIFHFQVKSNPVYCNYINYLGIDPDSVVEIEQIPFLPISIFKSHDVASRSVSEARLVFESSATTGQITSKHYVFDPEFYLHNAQQIFEQNYGPLAETCILALLPSYLERGNSSLVYMAQKFIEASENSQSGFFLDEFEKLSALLKHNHQAGVKTLLIGVSFALLDLAHRFPQDLSSVILMETGGMKGRKKELIRSEFHQILKSAFNMPEIHSEYGMTELMSQAYSKGEGIFYCPPQMRVLIRDYADPFDYLTEGKTGGMNIIDLANVDSCAFIATSDLGKVHADGSFEVLGRYDHSDVRGCNLLYSS